MGPKKGKGKKGKKGKAKMKKFDLDLFGLLTFTRIHGAPFEEFMYTPDKKKKGRAPAAGKGKGKGKKKKKAVEVPKLMKFPPVPEDPAKVRKLRIAQKSVKDAPEVIITTMRVGDYPEKTTRPRLPLVEGGSIRDVICQKTFPLIPRPQPHGGVYGNVKCVVCAGTGGLLKTVFGLLHKKMRKLLETQFQKAKLFITLTTDLYLQMSKNYLNHIKKIFEEMGPTLDSLDESEWEDHQNVKAWKEKFRKLQKDLAALRAQLKRLRKNRDEEIEKRLAEKVAEMQEAQRQMEAIEARVREAEEMLRDWQENKDSKLQGPKDEIARIQELLQKIKNSILLERDSLRDLMSWEMKLMTERTVAQMEEIINADLDTVQEWLHPAWFRLFLENRRMQEERTRLQLENHLISLEVEALSRQVSQQEAYKREVEGSRTYFITPPSLDAQVDKFVKTLGPYPGVLELKDYPPTKFTHE